MALGNIQGIEILDKGMSYVHNRMVWDLITLLNDMQLKTWQDYSSNSNFGLQVHG